jgi:hypothetical protein
LVSTPFRKEAQLIGERLEYSTTDQEGAMAKASNRLEQIEIVHPNAAGLDIGAREIYGAIPPDRDGDIVKSFGTFTPDLERLTDC